jgi:two-component system, OmpR family, sensor kinase
VDTIFYTILDTSGNIVRADRPTPLNEELISRTLDGETFTYDQTMPDGTTVRVMLKPIRWKYNGEIAGVLQAASPLTVVQQLSDELTFLLAISSIVLLAVGAVGSYILTGITFSTVGQVTRKVRQIELSQDLSQRLPMVSREDEISKLVSTFNHLLERLQAAFDTQRRFIADSSHELRTPITVIKSNLHLLRQVNDPVERNELLTVTDGEVSRLNRMVNDLLYIAQMQAGHDVKPVLTPVELDSLLLDAFARVRPLALNKHQKLSLIHEDIATTMGDRDQLQHLVLNLLDNAIKYTQDGGAIGLGMWLEDGWARIEVIDNGPGISEEELPSIFERFYRTSEARRTQRSGSGLGLAIVRSIAEAHKGRVEVFSQLGEGTTFRLWLRLMETSQAPELALPSSSEDTEVVPALPQLLSPGVEVQTKL